MLGMTIGLVMSACGTLGRSTFTPPEPPTTLWVVGTTLRNFALFPSRSVLVTPVPPSHLRMGASPGFITFVTRDKMELCRSPSRHQLTLVGST